MPSVHKLCTVNGCSNHHHGRGMCRLHYRQSQDRSPDLRVERECVMCGTKVMRNPRVGYKYGATCSDICRRRMQFGWSEPLPELHWARMYGATCEWSPPTAVTPARPSFVGCTCADCGAQFITPDHGQRTLYCSARCVRRVAKRKRRAREQNAPGDFRYTEVVKVYINQGKVCAYCMQPVLGLPDPEHVLPLSRGGHNDITNLVASCRACNNDKGDLTLTEWAASRHERGLPTLRTELTSDAFTHLVLREPDGPAWRHSLALAS